MAKVRLSEWKNNEVINCCDCKKLGYIEDLIIDECKGCIEALVVPEGGKWCNFIGDGKEYIIPISCIKSIGIKNMHIYNRPQQQPAVERRTSWRIPKEK